MVEWRNVNFGTKLDMFSQCLSISCYDLFMSWTEELLALLDININTLQAIYNNSMDLLYLFFLVTPNTLCSSQDPKMLGASLQSITWNITVILDCNCICWCQVCVLSQIYSFCTTQLQFISCFTHFNILAIHTQITLFSRSHPHKFKIDNTNRGTPWKFVSAILQWHFWWITFVKLDVPQQMEDPPEVLRQGYHKNALLTWLQAHPVRSCALAEVVMTVLELFLSLALITLLLEVPRPYYGLWK